MQVRIHLVLRNAVLLLPFFIADHMAGGGERWRHLAQYQHSREMGPGVGVGMFGG